MYIYMYIYNYIRVCVCVCLCAIYIYHHLCTLNCQSCTGRHLLPGVLLVARLPVALPSDSPPLDAKT